VEEGRVTDEASAFARAIRMHGAVRELPQNDGLSWWERAGARVIEAMTQAATLARDLWRRIMNQDRDNIGPDR
jgi:hypothetical protein